MFSISPRKIPAGMIRSATIAFPLLLSLPAPKSTHLRRYLYVLVLWFVLLHDIIMPVNTNAPKKEKPYVSPSCF